jgi:hypothetical protein
MKAEQYIEQQIKAGYKIHLHDGVWWQQYAPWFYRPVVPLQKLTPGSVRPSRLLSVLGYSHLVDDPEIANKYWPVMMLKEESLELFSISALSSSKRARVRKGLKLNEVRKIANIDPVITEMQQICISAAKRTGHGRPPEYYVKNAGEWEAFMRKEFAIPGREWWGAFQGDVLVAYYYAYLVDETMFISAAKSHSDYLQNCPNDALLFSFLEFCRGLEDCRRVIFGDWSDAPSLNEFKERYGFQKVDLLMYTTLNKIVKWARKIK